MLRLLDPLGWGSMATNKSDLLTLPTSRGNVGPTLRCLSVSQAYDLPVSSTSHLFPQGCQLRCALTHIPRGHSALSEVTLTNWLLPITVLSMLNFMEDFGKGFTRDAKPLSWTLVILLLQCPLASPSQEGFRWLISGTLALCPPPHIVPPTCPLSSLLPLTLQNEAKLSPPDPCCQHPPSTSLGSSHYFLKNISCLERTMTC